jgi:hypothetical protein
MADYALAASDNEVLQNNPGHSLVAVLLEKLGVPELRELLELRKEV